MFNVRSVVFVWLLLIIHFQIEFAMATHVTVSDIRQDVMDGRTLVSDVQRGVLNTHANVSDIHRNILKTHGGTNSQHQAVCDIRVLQHHRINAHCLLDSKQVGDLDYQGI